MVIKTIISWVNEEPLKQWQHQVMKLQLFPTQPPEYLRTNVEDLAPARDDDWSLQRIRCECFESYDRRVRPIIHRRFSADTLPITSSDEED